MNTNLIQCGDHKMAPWSVVCIHLIQSESNEWIPIESTSPEVDYDWTCPECVPEPNKEINIENLRPVCIHCVRKLRKELDPKYTEENDDF